MALAFDAASSAGTPTSSTTKTWAHTCSGVQRLLVVGVTCLTNLPTGVTYNSAAMTLLGTKSHTTANPRVALYYLVAPTTGANNVVVSFGSATVNSGGGISFTGADSTTPVGTMASAEGSGTTITVNVASGTGEIVVDSCTNNWDTISVGASQTSRYNTGAGVGMVGGGSTEPGAATVTMSWTIASAGGSWVTAGVSVKPQGPIEGAATFSITAGMTQAPANVLSVAAGFSATLDMSQLGGQGFLETLGLTVTLAQEQAFAWEGNFSVEFSITPDFALSPNLVVPGALALDVTMGMDQALGLSFSGVVTFALTPGIDQIAGGVAEGALTFSTTLYVTPDGRIRLVDAWVEADAKPHTEYREGD